MASATLERVVKNIVRAARLNPAQPLDENTPLLGAGLSLDSVAVLELLVALEKEFDLELNPDELIGAKALKTVGTLTRFIEARTKAG